MRTAIEKSHLNRNLTEIKEHVYRYLGEVLYVERIENTGEDGFGIWGNNRKISAAREPYYCSSKLTNPASALPSSESVLN